MAWPTKARSLLRSLIARAVSPGREELNLEGIRLTTSFFSWVCILPFTIVVPAGMRQAALVQGSGTLLVKPLSASRTVVIDAARLSKGRQSPCPCHTNTGPQQVYIASFGSNSCIETRTKELDKSSWVGSGPCRSPKTKAPLGPGKLVRPTIN